MNILKRLPDDIQEIIYLKIHQSNMKSIKNELEDELNKRWKNRTWKYLYNLYPTEYAKYRLCPFIRPDKVFFNGCCKFEINLYNTTYKSPILFNPTYGEILLEVDKIIIEIMEEDDDYDDISLEVIELMEDELIIDKVYGEIHNIYIELY